jgi:hypothetical protein
MPPVRHPWSSSLGTDELFGSASPPSRSAGIDARKETRVRSIRRSLSKSFAQTFEATASRPFRCCRNSDSGMSSFGAIV